MAGADPNSQLKITVIGEHFVGKTSIVGRYVDGVFDETYSSTIGISLLSKVVPFQGKNYELQIWDTSGSERHRAVAPSYYRGSDGCFLVYDVTNQNSLEQLSYWTDEFRSNVQGDSQRHVPLILLGNKSDLDHSPETIAAAEKWAELHDVLKAFIVSAKTGENITEAFSSLLEACLENQRSAMIGLFLETPKSEANGCSC